MTQPELTRTNWAPTRASTAIALLGTAAGVGTLSNAVGIRTGTAVAAGGAVCLAVALWLLTFDRWRVPATIVSSLLLVPAGAGVAAGIGYESLVAFAASFPAGSPTAVVAQSLRIFGVMAVLWGCTVAVFGAGTSTRSVATGETLSRCLGLANRVALLPTGFFLALSGHALATNFGLGAASALGELLSTAIDWLFAPAGGQLHLLAFWLLLTAASYATHRAVRDLPLRALVGETTVGDVRVAKLVQTLRDGFGGLAALAALGLPLAFLAHVAVSERRIREVIPDGAYGALVTLTSSGEARHLLAWVALIAGALAIVATLVRRSSRTSTRDVLVGYAPFLAGAVVVAGVGVAHRPVLDGLVEFVAGRLDPPLTGQFRAVSGRVVEFYGPETVVLGLTTAVLTLAMALVFALYLSFALGFVSDRVAGPSLAGGGLFFAAAFAGTLNTSLWLVLGSLLVALVVWDAGEFATTLGAEVGRRAQTRRVELLHGLSSLSVGVFGVVVAAGLAAVIPTGLHSGVVSTGELGSLAVALLGAVAAVIVLVMALR